MNNSFVFIPGHARVEMWQLFRECVIEYTHTCVTTSHHITQVICHGIPDARELQSGDLVNVDVTAYLNGYHGDLNEVPVASMFWFFEGQLPRHLRCPPSRPGCHDAKTKCFREVRPTQLHSTVWYSTLFPTFSWCFSVFPVQTFTVGEVDEGSQRLCRTAYECLHKAIAMCKPGTRYRDLGDVITKHASSNGCAGCWHNACASNGSRAGLLARVFGSGWHTAAAAGVVV